jgi:hypothetical protein
VLAQADVESYYADYRTPATTYHLPSGDSYSRPLETPEVKIRPASNAERARAAIRGARRGEVQLPRVPEAVDASVGNVVGVQTIPAVSPVGDPVMDLNRGATRANQPASKSRRVDKSVGVSFWLIRCRMDMPDIGH